MPHHLSALPSSSPPRAGIPPSHLPTFPLVIPPTRAGISPLALEPVCLSPRHSGPRAGIHPLHPRTELDHIMSPNPQSLLLFPSPPVPNQGTRHRSIPNLSSSPPPPGTELGAHSCALAHECAPILFSPSPLKALRERGTKGVRVPQVGGVAQPIPTHLKSPDPPRAPHT